MNDPRAQFRALRPPTVGSMVMLPDPDETGETLHTVIRRVRGSVYRLEHDDTGKEVTADLAQKGTVWTVGSTTCRID